MIRTIIKIIITNAKRDVNIPFYSVKASANTKARIIPPFISSSVKVIISSP